MYDASKFALCQKLESCLAPQVVVNADADADADSFLCVVALAAAASAVDDSVI